MHDTLRKALQEYYGLSGTLHRMPGENLNYLLRADNGQDVIAKIAGEDVPQSLVDMECAAILHAQKANLALDLPAVVLNRQGGAETPLNPPNATTVRLRVLSFVQGQNLSDRKHITDELRYKLGECLARFDLAMADFNHPAAHRRHRWDLADASQHETKTSLIDVPEQRALLAWAFEQFRSTALPVLPTLPWQFIHGDGNPENIRVAGDRVSGLLDFGDSCHNPAVCELAICLAYQMMDHSDPYHAAGCVISGYESIRPLMPDETKVLYPLACARLAVSISVAAKRRTIDASNDNWFVTEAPAWRLLSWFRSAL